ncbi:carboxypeptidase-like regulatory domain-containing protein [Zobellia laminariae]|uniref:carboxypeptidase-like regulatory domain-containing protein n=1 Tax=Zobellia laminariae TaxID=248906 RepID=UPI0026F46A33|nr:carboxypeptidase-like regulatory domain-containing protein [Zobellia laminariae]WKX76909.1 carboxypeptidase-like regulatory domain-containing protein [Zobellia laminariae]
MQNTIVFLLLFFTTLISYSQEKVIVTGQLFDSETQETLPFANVSINSFANNALVTGAITDIDGRFEIQEIPLGKYEVYFSFIGYANAQQTLVAGGLNTIFDLGKIELKPSAEALEEVQVIGKQAATNSDLNKKSFSLADNIAQSGGSVLDAMKTILRVAFDQEGKVVLRGSDKVVVLC